MLVERYSMISQETKTKQQQQQNMKPCLTFKQMQSRAIKILLFSRTSHFHEVLLKLFLLKWFNLKKKINKINATHSISESPMNSTILAKKGSHLTYLLLFLAPAVGNGSHWVLCYRGSLDGWAASTFHSRCDGKKNTVTIIEKGSYVFGGYTDAPWGKIIETVLNLSALKSFCSIYFLPLFFTRYFKGQNCTSRAKNVSSPVFDLG